MARETPESTRPTRDVPGGCYANSRDFDDTARGSRHQPTHTTYDVISSHGMQLAWLSNGRGWAAHMRLPRASNHH
jgi:hypothetical protein